MVEKVDIPVEEKQETQEYLDEMSKKADVANEVKIEEAPSTEEESPILGNFKTQDDLIKSYQELEKKLSERQEDKTFENEKTEDKPLEAGKFDFASAEKEFTEKGELSEDTLNNLEKMGLPKSYVDNYIAGLEAQSQAFEQTAYNATGGEENYKSMTDWVTQNLPQEEIQQFNDSINQSNDSAMFAIKGMYARYSAETREPNLSTGDNSQSSGSAYESVGQMKADMSDPRYATDSAFRKMVADKVARSKVI